MNCWQSINNCRTRVRKKMRSCQWTKPFKSGRCCWLCHANENDSSWSTCYCSIGFYFSHVYFQGFVFAPTENIYTSRRINCKWMNAYSLSLLRLHVSHASSLFICLTFTKWQKWALWFHVLYIKVCCCSQRRHRLMCIDTLSKSK